MPWILNRDFSGGIDNRLQERLIQDNQLADCLNVNLQTPGEVSRRTGFTTPGVGSANGRCVGLGSFKDSSGNERVCVATSSTNEEFNVYHGAGPSYHTDLAGTVTVQGAPVQFEMGIAHDGAAAYDEVIFLSSPTMDLAWWNGDLGANATSTTAVQNVRTMSWFRDHLWYVEDSSPYELFWSDWHAGNINTGSNSIWINEGDGEIITGLVKTRRLDAGELIVLKEKSVWAANVIFDSFVGTNVDTNNSYVRAITHEFGMKAPNTAKWIGDSLLFLAHDGVRILGAQGGRLGGDERLGPSREPLSLPIKGYIDRINWAQKDRFWAEVYDNRYYLSVCLDSESENTTQLIFDGSTGSWSVDERLTGPMILSDVSDDPTFFYGSSAAGDTDHLFQEGTGFVDAYGSSSSTNITSSITTKAFDLAAPFTKKNWYWLQLNYKASADETVEVEVRQDGGGWQQHGSLAFQAAENPTLPVTLSFFLAEDDFKETGLDLYGLKPSRDVQFRLTGSANSNMRLYDMHVRYEIEGAPEGLDG